jgi:hypothetical protein
MLIFTKLCVVMGPKMLRYSNNSFKKLFLIHLTYVLGENSVVEYSYRSVS